VLRKFTVKLTLLGCCWGFNLVPSESEIPASIIFFLIGGDVILSAFMFKHSTVDFSCLLTLTSNLLNLVTVVLMCLLKFGINITKHIIFE